ncbi:GNAT family N-acetyltransferase [Pseudovibrio exalbescens]|uniref:GNAT family N-acetyltransferase n=1 Tax=Pseudovibrio exalbescens TaxID=197461 RepID=UPI0023660F0F|nr:GNAT family N-acetyltransferase [Pseudovibrio exalbescens]MDD7912005.1 GNAT family N-acetyltransferase [Pseudovibrio exalbescens]
MNHHATPKSHLDCRVLTPCLRNSTGSADPTVSRGRWQDDRLDLFLDGQPAAQAVFGGIEKPDLSLIHHGEVAGSTARALFLAAVEAAFADHPGIDEIRVGRAGVPGDPRDFAFLGGQSGSDGAAYAIMRSGFYQSPLLWLGHMPAGHAQAGLVAGPDGRDHPLRPLHPTGVVYERYDPVADMTVSFRALDIDRDIDRFHRWMNDPRVAYYWELANPKEDLRAYLEKLQASPHTYPLIGCFDGDEAGYFETYWVREDRLGPYYDSAPYDRGWHGLIGERHHLGKVKTGAWLRSLVHYLFLDCPMTENIMGEPRVDNAKLLTYASSVGYEKLKEFDFPHKRSALMCCRRERFFSQVRL